MSDGFSMEVYRAGVQPADSDSLPQPQWTIRNDQTINKWGGIFLGITLDWQSNFKSEQQEYTVYDDKLGVAMEVYQRSQGTTGITVRRYGKYAKTIEAMRYDPGTRQTTWEAMDEDNKVEVAQDRGNIHLFPTSADATVFNFGNPGVLGGILRVTGHDGSTKYVAAAADFKGKPDHWTVDTVIAEVIPAAPGTLPATIYPELMPPAQF